MIHIPTGTFPSRIMPQPLQQYIHSSLLITQLPRDEPENSRSKTGNTDDRAGAPFLLSHANQTSPSVPQYRATATTTRQTSTIPSSPNAFIDFAQPLPSQHQLSTALGTQILPAASRLPTSPKAAFFSLYRPLGTSHRPKTHGLNLPKCFKSTILPTIPIPSTLCMHPANLHPLI
ncbi:uncharacterized protein CLUP02_11846 [Colletotrichum lupini]|uniref:Uncharacterized protein n=1 Tax=Colletotrichum lupini TaxID=145971 RepID=A0A9Q8WK76_9PEZI|nr:uncharacterized protein CLUP02_11846 [Colletotrichum lupini]UQC86346.1 hypothetical protein CLUP02_11846 [Colletotrichum lupini]